MSDTLALHDPRTYDHGFPHERFRHLRDHEPISRQDHPAWPNGYWVITRHADVVRVSRDAKTFSNAPNPFFPAGDQAGGDGSDALLISLDDPAHFKLRSLISRGFTPKRVADLAPLITKRVDDVFATLAERNHGDLVRDVALWLPLHVIADLVGVPEDDRAQVFEWTELTFGFDVNTTPEEQSAAMFSMYAYADALCQARRTEPKDDLVSVLLAAEVDGEQLTQMEIDLFFLLLQNAGSETTRNLITSGTLALLERPDQLALLRDNPNLIPNAVEELLRFTTPVIQFTRTALVDTEIASQQVAAGDHVLMVYSSANRDERAFDQPDQLDVTRDAHNHVAFGAGGPHFCLGAALARLEAKIMFEAILHRFVGLEVDGDPTSFPRVNSNLIDGFSSAPIRWGEVR
jgi:cholest-4-en-3-one 26-monooxygenase